MRILITFLAGVLVFGLVWCGKDEQVPVTSEQLPETEEKQEEKEVQMVGDVEVVIEEDTHEQWTMSSEQSESGGESGTLPIGRQVRNQEPDTSAEATETTETPEQQDGEAEEKAPEPERDYDEELDAFLEEILSAVE